MSIKQQNRVGAKYFDKQMLGQNNLSSTLNHGQQLNLLG
jgi:hypothetical protein